MKTLRRRTKKSNTSRVPWQRRKINIWQKWHLRNRQVELIVSLIYKLGMICSNSSWICSFANCLEIWIFKGRKFSFWQKTKMDNKQLIHVWINWSSDYEISNPVLKINKFISGQVEVLNIYLTYFQVNFLWIECLLLKFFSFCHKLHN